MKLMIVAHPDDESLFGGVRLTSTSEWKVLCLTNGRNKVRRMEFEAAMRLAGASPEMLDHPDRSLPFDEERLEADLRRIISGTSWDQVVTHNEGGEYGHPHHIQVHRMVKSIHPQASFFDLSGPMLPDHLWESKLKLIDQYDSQKSVCAKFLTLARMERP